jgi:hypothetical protein
MKSFIEKYYDETKLDTDRIFKDDLLALYRQETKLYNISWGTVHDELRRLQIKFDPQLRAPGCEKGAVLGLVLKQEIPKDLFEEDEQPKKVTKKNNPLDENIEPDTDTETNTDSESDSGGEETDYEEEDDLIKNQTAKLMKLI